MLTFTKFFERLKINLACEQHTRNTKKPNLQINIICSGIIY